MPEAWIVTNENVVQYSVATADMNTSTLIIRDYRTPEERARDRK